MTSTLTGTAADDSLTGSQRNDLVAGLEGNDLLAGRAGNDVLQGGAGSDTLSGGRGDDTLDGGAGLDVAVYQGSHSGYAVSVTAEGNLQVRDKDATDGLDGKDTLTGVEGVRFADGVSFAVSGTPPLATVDAMGLGSMRVLVLSDGSQVLVWDDWRNYGRVEFVILDAAGALASGPVSLRPLETDHLLNGLLGIAEHPDGGFVISWIEEDWSAEDLGSHAKWQHFDSTGQPTHSQVTGWDAWRTGFGVEAVGENLLLTRDWKSSGDNTTSEPAGQLFSLDGTPASEEFALGSGASASEIFEPVGTVVLADGGFAAFWQGLEGVFLRAFDADGAPRGEPYSPSDSYGPTHHFLHPYDVDSVHMTALEGGGLALVWRRLSAEDDSGYTTQLQYFDNLGHPAGGPITVAREYDGTFPFDAPTNPKIASLADGGVIVTWAQDNNVMGLRFDALGTPTGNPFVIHPEIDSYSAYWRALNATPDGGYIVSWLVEGPGGGTLAFHTKRFDAYDNHVVATWSLGETATAGTGTTLDELMLGNALANTLNGGLGKDALHGFAGDDSLVGGKGNDSLDGGTGADTLAGGTGADLYVVGDAGDVVTESFNGGYDTLFAHVSYTLPDNVESLRLAVASAATQGSGNELNNIISGNEAANNLQGMAGNDTLRGNAGADTLVGGAGDDLLLGGNGNDAALFSGTADDYLISLDSYRRVVVADMNPADGNEGTDTLAQVEVVRFADGTTVRMQVADAVVARSEDWMDSRTLTALADGGYVHLYQRASGDGSEFVLKRFSAAGVAQGDARTWYTPDHAYYPVLLADADGGYTLVRDSGDGIIRLRFAADGTASPAVTVTSEEGGLLNAIRLGNGNSVVTWSVYSPGDDDAVMARLYGADGAAMGDAFVARGSLDDVQALNVAALTGGGFAIMWHRRDFPAHEVGIVTFDAGGNPLTETSWSESGDIYTSVAGLAGGGVVSLVGDHANGSVTVRILEEDGTPRGTSFSVPDADGTGLATVIALVNGDFVVVSESDSGATLNVRRYDDSGVQLGSASQISTGREQVLEIPVVEALADGGFVIAWHHEHWDGHSWPPELVINQLRFDASGEIQHAVMRVDLGATALEYHGTVFTDRITGNALDNTLAGGEGHDTLIGGGGTDLLYGGTGNDVFVLNNLVFESLHGGDGDDTLRLNTRDKNLDLTRIANERITGVEVIDITGSGDNRLVLSASEVLAISPESSTLTVRGNAGDTLTLRDLAGWSYVESLNLGGQAWDYYTQGGATLVVAQDILVG